MVLNYSRKLIKSTRSYVVFWGYISKENYFSLLQLIPIANNFSHRYRTSWDPSLFMLKLAWSYISFVHVAQMLCVHACSTDVKCSCMQMPSYVWQMLFHCKCLLLNPILLVNECETGILFMFSAPESILLCRLASCGSLH